MQEDIIPQLSGVLMMQPLARTATNAAYCATASGDATSQEYRIHLQTEDGALSKHCRMCLRITVIMAAALKGCCTCTFASAQV